MGARNILRLFSEGIKGDRASVTQAAGSARDTAVVINAMSGTITTDDADIAAAGRVSFTVTNNKVKSGDVVVVSHAGTAPAINAADVSVSAVADGSFKIDIINNSGGTNSTEVVLNFVVLGGSPT